MDLVRLYHKGIIRKEVLAWNGRLFDYLLYNGGRNDQINTLLAGSSAMIIIGMSTSFACYPFGALYLEVINCELQKVVPVMSSSRTFKVHQHISTRLLCWHVKRRLSAFCEYELAMLVLLANTSSLLEGTRVQRA